MCTRGNNRSYERSIPRDILDHGNDIARVNTDAVFETSTQAQFLIPMAVSLAIGILFASIMIVFVVPALILIREDLRFKEPDLQQDITHEQPRIADLVST